MSRLIHLNGLPGVGKSTLARCYVDDHPLALNLDVDLLRRALGQWQRHPTESGVRARSMTIAAIKVHLRAGFDVVVPQFVARPEFLVDLAEAAAQAEAECVEVWVRAPLETIKQRFRERTDRAAEPHHVEAARMLGGSRGPDGALDELNDDLERLLHDRGGLVVVDTGGLTPEHSYRLLLHSLPAAATT